MPISYKLRRGPAITADTIALSEGELYMDTTNKNIRIHDGTTMGGTKLLNANSIKTINGSSLIGSGDLSLVTDISGKVDKINITGGTVGSGSAIPVITYNAQGQITSVSTSALNIPANIATETYVNTQISNLVNSAPAALDTLKELATALGNDSNFSTTVTNSLAGKQSTLISGTNIKTINGSSILGSGNIITPTFSYLTETNIAESLTEVISNTVTTSLSGAFFTTASMPFINEGGSLQTISTSRQFFASSNITLGATFEFWYKPTTNTADEYIFAVAGQNGNSFSINRNSGYYYTDVNGTYGGSNSATNTLLAINQWNHVALYLSTTDFKYWFNGTLVNSGTFPHTTDDYRQTNPRTGIYLGGHWPTWTQPQGCYGRVLITSGDKYNTTNSITVPTASFNNDANTQFLLKYVPLTQTVNSSKQVIATSFSGDGSKLTNVDAPSKIYYKKPSWTKNATTSNVTQNSMNLIGSATFTANSTGSILVQYNMGDVYIWSQAGGNLGFKLEVIGNTTEYDEQFITNLVGYAPNTSFAVYYRPFKVIAPVTSGSTVTINFYCFPQSMSGSGSSLFNYPGNSNNQLLTYQYVNATSF